MKKNGRRMVTPEVIKRMKKLRKEGMPNEKMAKARVG